MSDPKDLLGQSLTETEAALLGAYEGLKDLLDRDLSPTARAAVAEALGALWQVVNNLALTDDRPGV